MKGLQQLNAEGCGVCRNIRWDEDFLIQKREEQEKGWQKLIRKVKYYFTKNKEYVQVQPWCELHKKFVPPVHKCINYNPKKQLKIWGNTQDEEVKFDRRMIRNK
jgi:hypothetical protein